MPSVCMRRDGSKARFTCVATPWSVISSLAIAQRGRLRELKNEKRNTSATSLSNCSMPRDCQYGWRNKRTFIFHFTESIRDGQRTYDILE